MFPKFLLTCKYTAFRGTKEAFQFDASTVALVRDMIENGEDVKMGIYERGFLYIPLEHSEDIADHELCISSFTKLVEHAGEGHPLVSGFLKYAGDHKAIIDKYGRYPHRNAVLGRESTPEEVTYLETAERFGQ